MINIIESRSNDKIKLIKKLSSSSRLRNERQEFFLEGTRLCHDAAVSGIKIKQVFFTKPASEKYSERLEKIISCSDEVYEISCEVAEKIAETQSSQGIFAVCKMPKNESKIDPNGKYIFLENIQDPSNLGAIARTAEALGTDGAILCSCCDIYNPKAQRSAMGSLLRLPIIFTNDAEKTLLDCQKAGMLTLASTPDSSAKKITNISFDSGTVMVVGNEGNGVKKETMAVCQKVTIPMQGRAESLNASMAAALLMWEMMR